MATGQRYNPIVGRRAAKAYYWRNVERLKLYAAKRRQALRDEAFAVYGARCICCGEDEREFLTFDHIQPKGKAKSEYERKALPAWLKREGYPSGFQTLCFNCNCAKAAHGHCPHQK